MLTDYTALQAYASAYSSPEPPILARINEESQREVPRAHMLAGHLQGRILAMLSRMIKPLKVLEIGTFTGYATLCLAEGLADDGILYTIDIDASLADRVRSYFKGAGKDHQIDYRIGRALDILPEIVDTFDLVFIDADKKNYSTYYDIAMDKLNPKGWIVIDNVLWKSKVLEPNCPTRNKGIEQHIIALNNKIHNDPRTNHVLLPIRDGLMIVQKK